MNYLLPIALVCLMLFWSMAKYTYRLYGLEKETPAWVAITGLSSMVVGVFCFLLGVAHLIQTGG